jgi:hypothetical protein
MGILIELALLTALSGSIGLAAYRRRKRIDRDLEAFYVDHLERILTPDADDAMVLSVFEHLAEFGAEIDAKLRTMEERLLQQEAENQRLQHELRWAAVSPRPA